MSEIGFEWDPRKDKANRRKHGVGFAEASTVFGDPLSLTISDASHSADEERFIIAGLSDKRRMLVVVHTDVEGRVRIISARPATSHERQDYEKNFH